MIKKFLSTWKFLTDTLIYFVFPPLCPVCKEIVDERGDICAPCLEKILRKDFHPKPSAHIEKVMRITKYRGGVQKLLHKLKFDKSLSTLPALKKILESVSTDEIVTEFLKGIDLAVCVPLHAERLKERGYNQTELIFSDWLKSLNIPVENILLRTKKTKKLFDLSPTERKKVLQGAFETVEGADVAGKKILIVDDIYTTGATVTECAEALKKIGAAQVDVLALASDFGN
ncbi:MAG: ComF family protein [Selenomonadaceae bacterium]|nr:ComF family protein [Selenomonadaceae bacterium]